MTFVLARGQLRHDYFARFGMLGMPTKSLSPQPLLGVGIVVRHSPHTHPIVRLVLFLCSMQDDSLFATNRVFQVVTSHLTLYIRAPDEAMFQLWQQTLRDVCTPSVPLNHEQSRQPFTVVRCITLKLSEAKDLPKSGEYFALVLLDSEKQAKTLTKSNTNAPYWNQAFSFDDIPADVSNVCIELHRQASSIIAISASALRLPLSLPLPFFHLPLHLSRPLIHPLIPFPGHCHSYPTTAQRQYCSAILNSCRSSSLPSTENTLQSNGLPGNRQAH